jgi:hypothetical protein
MAELAALKKSQEHLLRLLEPSWKGLQHVVTGTKQLQSPLNSQDAILPLHFSRSSSYDTVVLTTTYRSTQTCEPTCCCACHSHVKIEMAGFLQQALGRLFVGYSGIPLLMGSCEFGRKFMAYRQDQVILIPQFRQCIYLQTPSGVFMVLPILFSEVVSTAKHSTAFCDPGIHQA